jgi:hypothetical protein
LTWFYHNTAEEFKEEHIADNIGYVYLITHIQTGKKYVGKKLFTKAGYRQIKGKKKKVRKASDWLEYWGSNTELQADVKREGEDKFTREILHLCKTRSECNYLELREQMDRRVLESSQYYNSWVSAKITKKHLKFCS